MERLRVIVVGPGLAGCTTVVASLVGSKPERLLLEPEQVFTWPLGDSRVEVQASRLGTLFGPVRHAWTDPVTAPDHARVKAAQAVMFVADSQEACRERNRGSLTCLGELLAFNACAASSLPLAILLNKRDLPSAASVGRLSSDLRWPGAWYFPTVAVSGRGVPPALDHLLRRAGGALA